MQTRHCVNTESMYNNKMIDVTPVNMEITAQPGKDRGNWKSHKWPFNYKCAKCDGVDTRGFDEGTHQGTKSLYLGIGVGNEDREVCLEVMFKLKSVGLMSSLGKMCSKHHKLPHSFYLLILLAQM